MTPEELKADNLQLYETVVNIGKTEMQEGIKKHVNSAVLEERTRCYKIAENGLKCHETNSILDAIKNANEPAEYNSILIDNLSAKIAERQVDEDAKTKAENARKEALKNAVMEHPAAVEQRKKFTSEDLKDTDAINKIIKALMDSENITKTEACKRLYEKQGGNQ